MILASNWFYGTKCIDFVTRGFLAEFREVNKDFHKTVYNDSEILVSLVHAIAIPEINLCFS